MNYLPVEGHPNLVRDVNTGAIINKERPSKRLSSEFNSMRDDINILKEELKQIKLLLLENLKKDG